MRSNFICLYFIKEGETRLVKANLPWGPLYMYETLKIRKGIQKMVKQFIIKTCKYRLLEGRLNET